MYLVGGYVLVVLHTAQYLYKLVLVLVWVRNICAQQEPVIFHLFQKKKKKERVKAVSRKVRLARNTPAEHKVLEDKAGFVYHTLLGEIMYAYMTCQLDVGYTVTTISNFPICSSL